MRPLIFLFLFCLSCSAYAQELFVDWGPEHRRTSTIVELLPSKGLDFYAYKLSSRNLLQTPRITRYENGDPVTTRRIDQKIGSNMVVLDDLITFNGVLTGFFRDRKDGMNSLYMMHYDSEGEPLAEPELVSSFPFAKKGEGKGSFNLITSQNGSFLCVEYIIPAKRDLYDRYGYKVLDSTFSVVSEGEYEIPYRQNDARVDVRYLTNRGDYILGISVYQSGQNGAFNDYSTIEKTVVVQVHKDTLTEYEMLIENQRVFDIGMNSDEGVLTVTGTYGKAFASGAEGVFVQQINLDNKQLLGQYMTVFPRDFMTKHMTQNQIDRLERNEAAGGNGPQLMNYQIREVHNQDKGTIVVAEQYFIYQQSSTDARGISQSVYQYFFNDLLIYKLDSAGTFSWIIEIPKEQQSINDNGYYSSEVSFISGGKLHCVFNDNRKNYDELGNYAGFFRTATFPARRNAYALAHAEIDLNTGTVTRNVLNDYNLTNGLVVMQLTNVNYKTREILFFSSGKKESFGLLRF